MSVLKTRETDAENHSLLGKKAQEQKTKAKDDTISAATHYVVIDKLLEAYCGLDPEEPNLGGLHTFLSCSSRSPTVSHREDLKKIPLRLKQGEGKRNHFKIRLELSVLISKSSRETILSVRKQHGKGEFQPALAFDVKEENF